ncbi:unnamed protein product [Mesocestoides corti]|uniref:Dynein light chain n=1 Tax=Mesocestoides corti TaxID=53468 RepID=A0A0R3UJN9_MESCO|nr:unnamed protein product [Mesocestoides corti]
MESTSDFSIRGTARKLWSSPRPDCIYNSHEDIQHDRFWKRRWQEKGQGDGDSQADPVMDEQPPKQLSLFGALVAQRALRKFLAPHKGLFSKLSLRRFSRLSISADDPLHALVQREPTYQLGPLKPFKPQSLLPVVEEIIQGLVDRAFKRVGRFDPGSLAKNLANDVRVAVRGLGPPRFKYVVHAIVTEDIGQSMLVASRVLWDHENDGQFSFSCQRDKHIIHVTVFACYHD